LNELLFLLLFQVPKEKGHNAMTDQLLPQVSNRTG